MFHFSFLKVWTGFIRTKTSLPPIYSLSISLFSYFLLFSLFLPFCCLIVMVCVCAVFPSSGPNSWDSPLPLTIKTQQLPNLNFEDCKIDGILRGALSQSMWNLKAKADGVQEKDSLMMMILMIKWKSKEGPLKGGMNWKAVTRSQKERNGGFRKFLWTSLAFLKQ